MISISEVDNHQDSPYTEKWLKQAIHDAVSSTIRSILPALANLENCTSKSMSVELKKGEEKMGSSYREQYTYIDSEGVVKKIRLNGNNKADTDFQFRQLIASQKNSKQSITLREFIDSIYRPSFMNSLAKTTAANYEVYLKCYILPFMGNLRMDEVTVVTIQRFYDWLASASKYGYKNDINKRSIDRIGGFARRIFSVAFEMHLIEDMPFKTKLLRNNGRRSGHHVALTNEFVNHVKSMIPTLPSETQQLYMGLLAYTGMRKEEILGLRWEAINLNEGYGEVKTVVVYPSNSVAVIKDTPKTTHSERTFLIPDALLLILKKYEKKTGFIIHGKTADLPIPLSTFRRMSNAAFKILGISNYNNHDWRATFGTQLKESGLSSAQVADLMGLADTRMVETVYARRRHEGVMMHKNTLNELNAAYAVAPKTSLKAL